jgi:hypothetical protein
LKPGAFKLWVYSAVPTEDAPPQPVVVVRLGQVRQALGFLRAFLRNAGS